MACKRSGPCLARARRLSRRRGWGTTAGNSGERIDPVRVTVVGEAYIDHGGSRASAERTGGSDARIWWKQHRAQSRDNRPGKRLPLHQGPQPRTAAADRPHPRPQPRTAAADRPHPRPQPRTAAADRPHPRPQPRTAAADRPHPRPQPRTAAADRPHPRPQPHTAAADRPHPRPQPHTAAIDRPHPRPQPHTAAIDRPHPRPQPRTAAIDRPHPRPQPRTASPSGGCNDGEANRAGLTAGPESASCRLDAA